MALWDEADMHVMRGPAATFSDPPRGPNDEPIATIGHIGRYALKHRLGEGGLGTVYAAHDPLLSRLIAVKTLNVEIEESERESFNALFLNEARAAGGLSHPHIVTVFDAGISDDRAYIAMELLKGRDLRQLREEGWRATPAQAALIVRRVADALGYAHSKGVVHRDIKPANIFMVGRTQPKVLDFGIARVAHRHDAHGGIGDIAAGSPYYMAPEQARQEPVDRRGDVFSLGVVLYELLTDVKPFRGATLDEITTGVLTLEPPLASVVDPAVPEALALIAAKAMAKAPDDRFRGARAFSRELRHWLDENALGAEDEAPGPTGRRLRWLGVAAVATLLIGGLVWTTLPTRRAEAPAAELAASAAAPAVAGASAASAEPVAAASPAASDAAETGSALPAMATSMAAAPAAAQTAAAALPAGATRPPAKESAKDKRARETREREARPATPNPAAPAPTGLVRIAISPWGEIEVDGKPAGTSPPLTELSLPQGRHLIVVRNTDLPAYSTVVNVTADQPVTLRHKF
jgi:serine/threonine-protein kinase